jgi:hypothetical protein
MVVSKIDDWGNEKEHGGPERKDACHEFAESHKAFNYPGNGFPRGYYERIGEHNENRGGNKDFQEGHKERKIGHHGRKDACPERKDGYPGNNDEHNGFQNPK